MNTRLLVDLATAVRGVADGATVAVPVGGANDADLAARWCSRTGHTFVGRAPGRVDIRIGRAADPLLGLPEELRPGRRLWLYSNFDCNLACDYCCVASSPRAPRRALSLDVVERIASEAPEAGVHEIYVTGGEPFLLADLPEILRLCGAASPTVVLTNGGLLRGGRLRALDGLPRDRVALQVSLDSADAALHDLHRGPGTHARALAGIRAGMAAGFRVRVAATLDGGQEPAEADLHRICDELGVPSEDRVIRRIARQGVSDQGLVMTREGLVPEVCLTADGTYWHPVAATDPKMRVTSRVLPLAYVIGAVTHEFAAHRRRHGDVASTFPCA